MRQRTGCSHHLCCVCPRLTSIPTILQANLPPSFLLQFSPFRRCLAHSFPTALSPAVTSLYDFFFSLLSAAFLISPSESPQLSHLLATVLPLSLSMQMSPGPLHHGFPKSGHLLPPRHLSLCLYPFFITVLLVFVPFIFCLPLCPISTHSLSPSLPPPFSLFFLPFLSEASLPCLRPLSHMFCLPGSKRRQEYRQLRRSQGTLQ